MNDLATIDYEVSTELPVFVNSVARLGTKSEWLELLNPKCDFEGNEFKYSKYVYQFSVRDIHIKYLGFPLLTQEVGYTLAKFLEAKKVIDVGCGTGYLTFHLKSMGVDIVGVDNYSSSYTHGIMGSVKHTNPIECDARDIDYSKYDVVILSWPDYESSLAYEVISKLHPGQIIIYQGESCGGCTGDDAFHDLITGSTKFKELVELSEELFDNHVRFAGIHDNWYIYQVV